jgi:mitochondrial fission protein ELM1
MSEEIDRSNSGTGTSTGSGAPAGSPRVWLVVGEKRGDNAQIRNLALAVGGSFEEKKICMAPEWAEDKPPIAASLDYVDVDRSDPLEGPWPDLVITAGRRLSSVALWIKRASGGRTRLVVIGKPRGRAADFDLIVVAAHYVMPDAPNVARHALPLMQVDREALASAKKAWVGRLLLLPRPLTALMIGGPTGGLRFDVETARDLLSKTEALVEATRGSLYITTSRRTPAAVADWLRDACSASIQLSLYNPDAPAEENPYQGLLALADNFVVTTDSLSMMVEAAQLGRPLSIYPLERDVGQLEWLLGRLGLMRSLSPKTDSIPAGGIEARLLAAIGRPIHSRDLSAVSRLLVDQGLATWLGDPVRQPIPQADESLERVVERIRTFVSSAGLDLE